MNVLKKTLVAGGILAAAATGAFAQGVGRPNGNGNNPGPACSGPTCGGTTTNNPGGNVTSSIKNALNFLSLNPGTAAAAVGGFEGCSVVTGAGFGGGYAGAGGVFNISFANKDFFITCDNRGQLRRILDIDPCLSINAMANGAPDEGEPGNPALRRAINSPQGAVRMQNICGYKPAGPRRG